MEVGDYVRTKQGRIGKISNLTVDYSSELILCEESSIPFAKHQIIKSSPNIIDLIEVGDYVNGCLVSEIKDKWLILNYADIETYEQLERKNENIKSIVTKEEFERMQYNLESEVN